MADIRIARPHILPLSRARAAAQDAADELAKAYALTWSWQGDTLKFQRSGVQGSIEVSPSQIAVEIRLGLLLKGMRKTIEQRVSRRLEELLVQYAPPVPEPAPVDAVADGEAAEKASA